MKYKKVNENEFMTIYEFSGEDVIVGFLHIDNNKKGKIFLFKDFLFKSEAILIDNSLSKLQDQISNYYSTRDTIAKIENEFPFNSK